MVRHAKRARLRIRLLPAVTDAVVVTHLPARIQVVFNLETAVRLRLNSYLEDEALRTLEKIVGLPAQALRD